MSIEDHPAFYFSDIFADSLPSFQGLSIVLRNIGEFDTYRRLSEQEIEDLRTLSQLSKNILDELKKVLDDSPRLASNSKKVGDRLIKVAEKLRWDEKQVDWLRSRITVNMGQFSAFLEQLIK